MDDYAATSAATSFPKESRTYSSDISRGWKIGSWLLCPNVDVEISNDENNSSSSFGTYQNSTRNRAVIFSPTALRIISILVTLIWLLIFGLLLILLLVCGVDINFGSAISSCGRNGHWLRPFFVATFAIYWVIMSLLFFSRAFMLHAKSFGLANARSKCWRMIFCGLTIPRRGVELKSVTFWLIWIQLLIGLISNILLLLMAIFPDQKETKSFHFVTAFLGLTLLLIYSACSVVLHIGRVIKVMKKQSPPFELFRKIDSKQIPSQRTWLCLSVTAHVFVIVWQLIFVLAGSGFVPAYVSTVIPVYEWLGVSCILLALFPHTFDTMMTDVRSSSTMTTSTELSNSSHHTEEDETNTLILK
ncbi:hypothetical protein C9374_001564 [Naegleria lovaniensis]|uniref:Uncharacterized protein n=1 Tax=Naegleria lovaniensis TaxID=51637 RepID=A0AA88GQX5_NAELO|nr:uncharacterized protein C9374_001564 [Naegleria lovaniensis]KAG2387232.1 hypothetical protein C9374_001564 [Naegleria lovaniensis]